jgi:hypothetical protein
LTSRSSNSHDGAAGDGLLAVADLDGLSRDTGGEGSAVEKGSSDAGLAGVAEAGGEVAGGLVLVEVAESGVPGTDGLGLLGAVADCAGDTPGRVVAEPMLRALTARIKAQYEKNSPAGQALSSLEEIRVTASPSWDAPQIGVFLSFCPATLADALAVMSEDDWDTLISSWIGRAVPTGVIVHVDGAMAPLDDLTALEYVGSDRLDLDHLSA